MILTEGARVRLRMMRREDADELYALLSSTSATAMQFIAVASMPMWSARVRSM